MRALMACSTGGHLDELLVLRPQLGLDLTECHWRTSENAHSRDALAGELHEWLPHIGSRQLGAALRNVPRALSTHRALAPDVVVSTGAAQAVPHLLAAAISRTPIIFIESVTRLDGRSLTGKIAARLPGTTLLTQTPALATHRWRLTPDVFDAFEAVPCQPRDMDQVVVSLGSERFPFPRAVDTCLQSFHGMDVFWQTGSTVARGASGDELTRWVGARELHDAIAGSDLTVVHAGVGSILASLVGGHMPVVLSRAASHGEHVDDHQTELAESLLARGLIAVAEPGRPLDPDTIERVLSTRIERRATSGADVSPSDVRTS